MVRYRIVTEVPAEARSERFCSLRDDQIRLRLSIEGDELVVVATGLDPAACERLLLTLGADEMGVDLCG